MSTLSLANPAARTIDDVVAGPPYVSYLYSYPHKSAYQSFEPPRALDALWAREDRSSLFLYIHVPFCEMRCGFCNLFTVVGTASSPVYAYLDTLARQSERTRQLLGDASFARLAIGGGTPTYLDERALHAVFDIAETTMGARLTRMPVSVETSPETATLGRLRALSARGVDRISIGVQSFHDAEVRGVGRAQEIRQVRAALERIRRVGFAALNIDLMYGLPGQTMVSWLDSIEQACAFEPEELYLYPLYVRPQTGLSRSSRARWAASWDAERLAMYRAGRDRLRERGYRQRSMRMFYRPAASTNDIRLSTIFSAYTCQRDGMVGLGAGARSYTDTVHYSTEYAVGSNTIKSIIQAYIDTPTADFATARYGVALDPEDRRRRHIILSLLSHEGLDTAAYQRRFGTDAVDDVPALGELVEVGLARACGATLSLTDAGVERSDAIGPWLQSDRIRRLMAGFALR